MDLTIVIVSYQSLDHLRSLIPSIYGSRTRYSYEVIVVDNSSSDGSAEYVNSMSDRLGNLKLMENPNRGYAAGGNLGIKASAGRYILLLNPDIRLQEDTLEIMLDFMEGHPEIGMSGCKVLQPDGKLDLACRRRCPTPWNSLTRLAGLSLLFPRTRFGEYNLTYLDPDSPTEVDSVQGAFLMTRRAVVDRIGLMDEGFFLYGEDLDWCWRCKTGGFSVWYYPRTSVVHFKGTSSGEMTWRRLKAFHDAMWRFYRKHYWKTYPAAFNYLVGIAIFGRMAVLLAVNALRSSRLMEKTLKIT